MPQIVLVSDNISTVNEVEKIVSTNSYVIKVLQSEDDIETAVKNDDVDLIFMSTYAPELTFYDNVIDQPLKNAEILLYDKTTGQLINKFKLLIKRLRIK